MDTDRELTAQHTHLAERTTCVVTGGGPAGMVLGLLLARAGIDVTVLEKHADFLRDFRGDTVHASTLRLLDELGLGDAFAALPQRRLDSINIPVAEGLSVHASLASLPGRYCHIAMVPQWDLLELLAEAARAEPGFTLAMNTEATALLRERGVVAGVRYRCANGSNGVLRADLTVAADGRGSCLRAESDLRTRSWPVPFDAWWFRVPRLRSDPSGLVGAIMPGHGMVMIDRGDYFQIAYLIPKGSDARQRDRGLHALHADLLELAPWLRERVRAVDSFAAISLLDVRLDRLRRWSQPGLLCIGDAAHAMSPVGGVGINLAVQDAVATARILAAPLLAGTLRPRDLAKVQLRRWLPTAVTQRMQHAVHTWGMGTALFPQRGAGPPLPVRAAARMRWLGIVPAYLVAIGVLPEHAPEFAKRASPAASTGSTRS
ncbi:MAG: FAD-dependent oxidoreductase [Sciscionella sp.]